MSQHQFKVGDRVVHPPIPGTYNAPYFYKMMGCSKDDKLIVTAISVNNNVEINNNPVGYWSPTRFKLYDEPTLADKLAEAKAEVARIEQLILESQTPKVGEWYRNSTNTVKFYVLDIYKGRVFGRRENANGGGMVQSGSAAIGEFHREWTKV